MIAGLAVLAAAVLVLAVLAVVMPLRLSLSLGSDPRRIDLRLAPFAGVFGEFRLPRRSGRRPATARRGARSRGRRRRTLRALAPFLGALVQHVRIDRLSVAARFGTGDPAETGQIYGQVMALIHSPFLPQAAEIRLSPVFDRACLAGEAEVALRITPLRVVWPVVRLVRAGYGTS